MNIVILSSRFPYPLEKGDKLRLYYQIRELSSYHNITLISLSEKKVPQAHVDKLKEYVDEVYVFFLPKYLRYLNLLLRGMSSTPFQVIYYYDNAIHKKINRIIRDSRPDHIYCHLVRMSEYVRYENVSKTIDYMDAFGVGMLRRSELVKGIHSWVYREESRRLLKYEAKIYDYFDHHTIISEQDKRQIKTHKRREITVNPNGVDTTFFKPIPASKTYDLAFIGNMGYVPNVEAAEILADIHKSLKKGGLHLKLLIAGARPDKRVLALQNKEITVSGWVDDIRSAYASARIFVAPIFSGTGQQNKIMEAMAMGIPCITTTSVINALGATNGKEVMIADSIEDFRDKIKELNSDKIIYDQISKNALQFVKSKYSWKKNGEILNSLFSGDA